MYPSPPLSPWEETFANHEFLFPIVPMLKSTSEKRMLVELSAVNNEKACDLCNLSAHLHLFYFVGVFVSQQGCSVNSIEVWVIDC